VHADSHLHNTWHCVTDHRDYATFATFAATIMLRDITGLLKVVSGAQSCL